MIKITLKNVGNASHVLLEGVVDEACSFDQIFKIGTTSLFVNCKNISRINSVGIELWKNVFNELRGAGIELTFCEVSTVLVEACNLLQGMFRPQEIQSICVPYFCHGCKRDTMCVVSAQDIFDYSYSDLKYSICSLCGNRSELDEDPDQYFKGILF